jgi:hypothetical protein
MENKLKKLEEEFGKIKKELSAISYLKKGSIVKCYQTCGNPGCRCHKDIKFKHGPYLWWISKEDGRTKSILVPQGMLFEAKDYIENYKLLKSKFKRMEEISEKIIKIKIKNYREELKKKK